MILHLAYAVIRPGKASYLVMLLLNNSVSFGAKVKSLFFHDAQASWILYCHTINKSRAIDQNIIGMISLPLMQVTERRKQITSMKFKVSKVILEIETKVYEINDR